MKFNNRPIQIACDGGAATGKSTGAKMLAKKYNLKFLSSGLLYRYAAFLIVKNNPKNKINFLKLKFKNLNYKKLNKLNLHTAKISEHTTKIAKIGSIRKILKKYQVDFSKNNRNCCIEGRDISTKIIPKSDLKFYFICNLKIAAKRRYEELRKKDPRVKYLEVKKALRIRNISDMKRKNSPLLKHRDSIEIDTSKLNKLEMVNKLSKHVERILNKRYGVRTRVK